MTVLVDRGTEATREDMEMEVDGVEGVVMADVEATEEVVEEEDFVVVEAEEEGASADGDLTVWFRGSIARRLGWIEVLFYFQLFL